MSKEREFSHLFDTIWDLILDEFLEGSAVEDAIPFAEQDKMEARGERVPDGQIVFYGLRITPSGRDYLERLKKRTFKAKFIKWLWRVACFVVVVVVVKLADHMFK